METLHKAVLKEGYYADGLSVFLKKSKSGRFYVFYYIHCEDRLSPHGDYENYSDALNDYENIIVTYC